jgi:hypothetical protein
MTALTQRRMPEASAGSVDRTMKALRLKRDPPRETDPHDHPR